MAGQTADYKKAPSGRGRSSQNCENQSNRRIFAYTLITMVKLNDFEHYAWLKDVVESVTYEPRPTAPTTPCLGIRKLKRPNLTNVSPTDAYRFMGKDLPRCPNKSCVAVRIGHTTCSTRS